MSTIASTTYQGTTIEAGQVFEWTGSNDGLTVTVISVNMNEEGDGFAGGRLAPYATTQWSDDRKQSFMNLATIVAYLGNGAFVAA
jgi:hypothetical protein